VENNPRIEILTKASLDTHAILEQRNYLLGRQEHVSTPGAPSLPRREQSQTDCRE
jgi:hypothetical protein